MNTKITLSLLFLSFIGGASQASTDLPAKAYTEAAKYLMQQVANPKMRNDDKKALFDNAVGIANRGLAQLLDSGDYTNYGLGLAALQTAKTAAFFNQWGLVNSGIGKATDVALKIVDQKIKNLQNSAL